MNYKMKLGYMALGAGILALGIIIGQIITPDIEAQNNGVFDEIQCSKLTVVDRYGKEAILLVAREIANGILVFDKAGELAIRLSSFEDEDNKIAVYDDTGKVGISLVARPSSRSVYVYDKMQGAVMLNTHRSGNGVHVLDKAGKTVWSAP